MRGGQPTQIKLSEGEQQELEAVTRRHRSAQQLVLRARIVLLANEGKNNKQIAQALAITVDTVRLWRDRWFGFAGLSLDELSVVDRLKDVPRPGAPAKITAEQICQIVALACEVPAQSERPISQWSGREIADELKKRNIVAQISPRHASRLLKKTIWCANSSNVVRSAPLMNSKPKYLTSSKITIVPWRSPSNGLIRASHSWHKSWNYLGRPVLVEADLRMAHRDFGVVDKLIG